MRRIASHMNEFRSRSLLLQETILACCALVSQKTHASSIHNCVSWSWLISRYLQNNCSQILFLLNSIANIFLRKKKFDIKTCALKSEPKSLFLSINTEYALEWGSPSNRVNRVVPLLARRCSYYACPACKRARLLLIWSEVPKVKQR